MITVDTFSSCDLRVGTVLSASILPNARVPAWVLEIDFGPLGVKRSSAQITDFYSAGDLTGRQVVAVINLPPRQIGSVVSECLVLGFPTDPESGRGVVLIQPDRQVENGLRLA